MPATQTPVSDGMGNGVVDPAKDRRVDEAIRRARASSVKIVYETWSHRRVTSGVVLNDQGEVLSVFLDPPGDRHRPSIQVTDIAGKNHAAHWLGTDSETGLTLLRVEGIRPRPIRRAVGEASLGADIFLIGNPYGLGHSVSRGHIAGLNRQLVIRDQSIGGLIQIQAPLHPGDSGALLADLDGAWLGLVRGTLAVPDENDMGFAIAARDAIWVADRLRIAGKVDRAYLGLRFVPDIGPDRAFAGPGLIDVPEPPAEDRVGARVVEVVAGSPAAREGLRPGDRVVRVDDRPILSADELTHHLDRTLAGVTLHLELVRGIEHVRLKVTTSPRPGPAPVVVAVPFHIARPDPAVGVVADAAASESPRPDDPAGALLRKFRVRLEQLERRVTELERSGQVRKIGMNP